MREPIIVTGVQTGPLSKKKAYYGTNIQVNAIPYSTYRVLMP